MTSPTEKNPENQQKKLTSLFEQIRERSPQLNDVLWSQEELIANKDFLNTANHKINAMIDPIIKNLYWYQKIGWKKFLPNRNEIEHQAMETDMASEKARFHDWLNGLMEFSTFYTSFHEKIPQSALLEKLEAHHLNDFPHLRILDFGCRNGLWLRNFLHLGVPVENMAGVEFYNPLLNEAKQQFSGTSPQLLETEIDVMPFEDRKFDLILVFGILMHVLDHSLQQKIGSELLQRLSAQGMIVTAQLGQDTFNNLEPYVAYATQAIGRTELAAIFTECEMEIEDRTPYTLTFISKKGGHDNL